MKAGVKNANDTELSTSSCHQVLCLQHERRHGDVDRSIRPHLGRAECRQVGLGVGVDTHEDVLPEVEVGDLGHCGEHGDLMDVPRIGEPALHDGEAILVEPVAVVAPEPVPGGGRERVQLVGTSWGPRGSTSSPDALPTLRTWGRCAILRTMAGSYPRLEPMSGLMTAVMAPKSEGLVLAM